MNISIEKKPLSALSAHPAFQQTAYWGYVKYNEGWQPNSFQVELQDNSTASSVPLKADLLVLTAPLSSEATMAYIPYLPLPLPRGATEGVCLEQLSEVLKAYLPSNCVFIRYDLDWESPWSKDENRFASDGSWMGEPDPYVQEMRMNFDTHYGMLRRSPSDVLPTNTVFMDLQHSRDEIMQGMKSKTRYNIRLSYRKGVSVREGSLEDLPAWYAIYEETVRRNGIIRSDYQYFRNVLTARKNSKSSSVHLLLAEKDGLPVAGMFLAKSATRATYLYGASSSSRRNLMSTYALQWEAMNRAKIMGCEYYDMFGVAPKADPNHPMYGLYRFKTGFGGDLFHRQGCWDYPYQEEQYELLRAAELQAEGYHTRN